MTERSLCALTATELARGMTAGEFSSQEIVRACLRRVARKNDALNVFLEVFEEEALEQARASDERRARGSLLSRLDGIPFAVKDNMALRGKRLTCGSRMLERYVSPYTATAAERLLQAGMPLLGRLNLDEFAMGSSTETSFFGPTRNPWDPSLIPGGSSGGSAAAVAAGMTPVALGSDTGGSIRQPAALCGVVGVKPAYGTVSRYGLAAMASSFDQIGPLCKTARDAALVMELLAGGDPRDMTSDPRLAAEFSRWQAPGSREKPLQGVSLALPEECFGKELPEETGRSVEEAAAVFQRMGARLLRVSLPSLSRALSAYLILSCAEAGSNLARYDGVRYGFRARSDTIDELYRRTRGEGFGMEVKRRVLLGAYSLSRERRAAYFDRAQTVRAALCGELQGALEQADVLLFPTAAGPAFPLGETRQEPTRMYLSDLYSVPANLAGLPALSFPCGLSAGGLPLGATLMGARASLSLLLGAATLYEEKAPTVSGRRPYERGDDGEGGSL